MANVVFTIDMDRKCAECGKPGAAGSGICMRCATKAMDPKAKLRSAEGRAVQSRLKELYAKTKAELKAK